MSAQQIDFVYQQMNQVGLTERVIPTIQVVRRGTTTYRLATQATPVVMLYEVILRECRELRSYPDQSVLDPLSF